MKHADYSSKRIIILQKASWSEGAPPLWPPLPTNFQAISRLPLSIASLMNVAATTKVRAPVLPMRVSHVEHCTTWRHFIACGTVTCFD